ncbi:hypothetical protein KAFR_0B06260 [Kazachstania africana CBS 2517]|uniref:Nonsense-mediated mRNA decay factor n=1 Tax=Kazachstania africana (strain ATCC 22294 / BCRC 22015 / CBS 2517 / CECT 1963 / NBRC 1671 / NRRL Y-8276) TaxID=1071382 RepID=H2ARC3_KAZAF|nr:hypothetical protein KAFR_0B06260 [Kazachstania africana CBS 2517]CCF56923.1 hypothetical protein KAFR_0B06260 [Kazachstania africana CBS 2517]
MDPGLSNVPTTATALSDKSNLIKDIIAASQNQLNVIFKSNQLQEDYGLLNGFISFVHSKLNRIINELISHLKSLQTSSESLKQYYDQILLILDLTWEQLWYPTFKWFQAWRRVLLTNKKGEQLNYAGLRKMNSKLNKYSKSVFEFYFNIMDTIVINFEYMLFIPSEIKEKLGLRILAESDDDIDITVNNEKHALLMVLFHRCVLYLGSTTRYKVTFEKFYNNYSAKDYKKALEFYHTAILLLPHIGEPFFQESLISLQCKDFPDMVYNLVRASLTTVRSGSAIQHFNAIMFEEKSPLRQKFNKELNEIHMASLRNTRIVNREIIGSYFFTLLASKVAPDAWIDKKINKIHSIDISHLENVLFETISTRYIRNIDVIFKNLIISIGTFQLLHYKIDKKSKLFEAPITALTTQQIDYLKFAFKYISIVIENVILESWSQHLESWEYLGIVRVLLCWIQSHNCVRQFAQQNSQFCKNFAKLLNDFLRNKKMIEQDFSFGELPTRKYYFDEDNDVKNFICIHGMLDDFNDQCLTEALDDPKRKITGSLAKDKKMDNVAESKLRLKAILVKGKKFMDGNECGISWDRNKTVFVLGTVKSIKLAGKSVSWKNDSRSQKSVKKGKNDNVTISMADLEAQLQSKREHTQSMRRNYSGSTIPMAPETFKVKPSKNLLPELKETSTSTVVNNKNKKEHIFNENGTSGKLNSYMTTLTPTSSVTDMESIENSLQSLSIKQNEEMKQTERSKYLHNVFQSGVQQQQGTYANHPMFPSIPISPPPYFSMPPSVQTHSGFNAMDVPAANTCQTGSEGFITTYPYNLMDTSNLTISQQNDVHPQLFPSPEQQAQHQKEMNKSGFWVGSQNQIQRQMYPYLQNSSAYFNEYSQPNMY